MKGPLFYRGKNDETYNLEKLQKVDPKIILPYLFLFLLHYPTSVILHWSFFYLQQFLYVELTALESELKKIGSERPSRSCQDVKLDQPRASSGTFTMDPNLGSSLDALKTYCDFDHGAPRLEARKQMVSRVEDIQSCREFFAFFNQHSSAI